VISIIIPTLNEEGLLPPLLDTVRQQKPAHEVIIVDGGSRDRTLEIARNRGVRTFVSRCGRGAGMAIGAEAARGDVLFFLYADSVLPSCALDRIDKVLAADANIIGGNFRLVFDGGTKFSRRLPGSAHRSGCSGSITAIPGSLSAARSTNFSADFARYR
jgi:glycosyltransferase involved in cell wall biosynthesis